MHSPIAHSLDALAAWRAAVDGRVGALARALAEHELARRCRRRGAGRAARAAGVRQAGAGLRGRVLARQVRADQRHLLRRRRPPRAAGHAGPHHDVPGGTALRRRRRRRACRCCRSRPGCGGLSLAELRSREEPWQHVPLDPGRPQTLVQALAAVTRTRRVSVQEAAALGFWNDDQPEDNPPPAARRHASRCRPGATRSSTTRTRCCSAGWW